MHCTDCGFLFISAKPKIGIGYHSKHAYHSAWLKQTILRQKLVARHEMIDGHVEATG
jgi:hypothetical protein